MVKRFSYASEVRILRSGVSAHTTEKVDKTSHHSDQRGETLLEVLASDYELSKSPGFVLQALVIAARYRLPMPEWVLEYFGSVAAPAIMDLFWDGGVLTDKRRTRNEAELVGKALGFSADGSTAKSSLAAGLDLDQAWKAYALILRELENGEKEYIAFEKGAEHFGVSAATVRRYYLRVREFVRQKSLINASFK
jgi:hypothetical protein